MKILTKTSFIVAVAAILTTATGCKKQLEEVPRANLYPDYFGTAGGVQAAVTGVYNNLRSSFGNEGIVYYYDGTDENIAGGSSQTNPTIWNSYNGINSSNGPDLIGLYTNINTLNGVLQYAPTITDATARTQYVAQAKFLRGWCYFLLVQTYGGTTATQQSGIPLHTTFITQATTADAPASLVDLYNLIIQDFKDAAAALPPTMTGSPFSANGIGKTATAAVANAYLAKAYLTRGYTEAKQTGDFQQAADITAALIANKGTYGLDLWQDYWDAHKPANDYGKENMFTIDFGVTDPLYSGNVQQGAGGFGINFMSVIQRFNYFTNTGVNNGVGIDAVPQKITGGASMLRDVYNHRPYIRIAPNGPYLTTAFADQIHDTRYDATFQTYWICNTTVAAGTNSTGGSKGQLIKTSNVSLTSYQIPIDGDTSILMPSADVTMARRDAFKGLIVTPKQFNNNVFPNVKKFDDPNRTSILDFSFRPLVLLRFSEVYLVNAEANYMAGHIPEAAASLNVIRQRSAYRTPADGAFTAKNQFSVTAATMGAANAANAAAMLLTPAQLAQLAIPNTTTGSTLCGMDLILEEYSREFWGDPRRWYDLVRTGQLTRRVKMYNPIGGPNIQDYHSRRPIPQTLIDAVLSGPKYPQNNQYN
ncbi:RagB/SusD family nutrient uptake outer membrane protein [Mucilaginibacter sp. HMF5004]|uniref:RagB/SusD family nutrient uptake outer membrane protein n=1 Tax=Mucilaginibacter rivuli TaxID=2857527 RepID=UPI001C5EAA63|nr:RagB/SusD family nutrient uptake outer membrane protein [Mucilaginibacter rivuli]MBW4890695.1 RagB/SusD family nutrient uptake outer membrane protein [Mucilaginibacter rivuli]